MIDLPSGFDASGFVSELFSIAAPFISVFMIIVAFVFVIKTINRVG